MSVNKITVREHTTADIIMQLLSDDVAIDLTSVSSVRLDLLDNLNKVYRYQTTDTSPALVITHADDGQITFTPPNANVFEYQRSPYKLYAWVFETATKRYSVPEHGYSQIEIEKEY